MPLFNPALGCGCCNTSGSGSSGSSGESGSSGISGQSSGISSGESSGLSSGESGSSGSSGSGGSSGQSGSGQNCFTRYYSTDRSLGTNQIYLVQSCCIDGVIVDTGSPYYSHDAGCVENITGPIACGDFNATNLFVEFFDGTGSAVHTNLNGACANLVYDGSFIDCRNNGAVVQPAWSITSFTSGGTSYGCRAQCAYNGGLGEYVIGLTIVLCGRDCFTNLEIPLSTTGIPVTFTGLNFQQWNWIYGTCDYGSAFTGSFSARLYNGSC